MSNNVSFSIDAIREAIFAIEQELGLVPSGVYKDVRTRLDVIENRMRLIGEEQKVKIEVMQDNVPVASEVSNLNFVGDLSVTKTGSNQATITINGASEANFKFVANCPAYLTLGDLVYITGPSISGVYQVDKVDITDITKMPAMGVIIDKMSAQLCSVMTLGQLDGRALTPNAKYYVGVNGKITNVVPSATAKSLGMPPVIVQSIGVALDINKLLFQPSFDLIKSG